MRKAFFVLSALPLLTLLAMKAYLRGYDGMTAGFAGLILLVPLGSSVLLGLLGLALLWSNDPRIPRDRALWVATGLSGSVAVWFSFEALL